MTVQELKIALYNKKPVIHTIFGKEKEYPKVSAIEITLNSENEFVVYAKLEDTQGSAPIYADPENVRYKEVNNTNGA
ncbi:MAG: hypothetical protein ACI4I4_07410 [Acutalibacteraceae bacterium]